MAKRAPARRFSRIGFQRDKNPRQRQARAKGNPEQPPLLPERMIVIYVAKRIIKTNDHMSRKMNNPHHFLRACIFTAAVSALMSGIQPANACDDWYIAGRIGQSSYAVADTGATAGNYVGAGFGAATGCLLIPYLAVENEYVNLGKKTDSYGNGFATSGFTVDAVGILPFSRLSLFGRAGLFVATMRGIGNDASRNLSSLANAGLGLEIPAANKFSLRIEYGRYQIDSKLHDTTDNAASNIDLYSIALKYKF